MAKRLSDLAEGRKNTTSKPSLFRLVAGKNGRTIYFATVEKMAEVKGKKYILFSGEEYDKDVKQMVKREMRAFLDEDVEKLQIKEGDRLVLCYAPAKNPDKPGLIEECASLGQCMSIVTEHDGKDSLKTIIYGVVKKERWNEKRNMFTISFIDLMDTAGKDYGMENKWIYDGVEYVSYWTNVSFFGATGNEQYKNRYPADRAEQDIKEGDAVVVMATYKKSTNESTGVTYINHNANKYMVAHSKDNGKEGAVKQADKTANPTTAEKPVNPAVTNPASSMQHPARQEAQPAVSRQPDRKQTVQNKPPVPDDELPF